MFPAYSSISKGASEPSKNQRSTLLPIIDDSSVNNDQKDQSNKKIDWLSNESFRTNEEKTNKIIKLSSSSGLKVSDSESSSDSKASSPERKHKKEIKKKKDRKKSKKKHKKHHKKRKVSESENEARNVMTENMPIRLREINAQLEAKLIDKDYESFFDKFTKDDLKKMIFYEDVPNLMHRNAFKLDKKGDKNNLSFDSVYFKLSPKYNITLNDIFDKLLKQKSSNKKKKQLTRKELRRQIILHAKEKRYFTQLKRINIEKEAESTKINKTSSSTISDRLWLYLEMKKELKTENNDQEDLKTKDYMKYLDLNKNDIDKWLEFINYQESLSFNLDKALSLYDKKQAIFDRALEHNPKNFRLRLEQLKLKSSNIEMLEINIYNSLDLIESEFLTLIAEESFNLNSIKLSQLTEFDLIIGNLFEIWFELLNFFLNQNSSSLYFDRIKKIFMNFFDFFLDNNTSSLKHLFAHFSSKSYHFLNLLLALVDKYTLFLCRCGYVEKAVAIYQALLDFNFYTDNDDTKLDLTTKIGVFGLYWDIGLPKFGEKLSTGWLNCLENREKIFKSIELDKESLICDDLLDQKEQAILELKTERIEIRWLEIERLRSMVNWYPFYPRVVLGESIDDCVDPDRFISFDDDLKFILFDLNSIESNQQQTECLKFKLLINFFKLFNLFTIEEECLSVKSEYRKAEDSLNKKLFMQSCEETPENFDMFNNNLNYFSFITSSYDENKCVEHPYFGQFRFLEILYANFVVKENHSKICVRSELFTKLLKNNVDFMRNCLKQSFGCFKSAEYRSNLIVLKWRFELDLLLYLNKFGLDESNEKDSSFSLYLNKSAIRENLLNMAKDDLSTEANRSNFHLWKQYGLLKWVLSNSQRLNGNNCLPKNPLKDTRKVFDTLLNTSASSSDTSHQSCINIYSLAIDYCLIEMNVFCQSYDIQTSQFRSVVENRVSISSLGTEVNLFNQENVYKVKKSNFLNAKETLSEILISNCLKKSKPLKINVFLKLNSKNYVFF
jgi:hypothetical protein